MTTKSQKSSEHENERKIPKRQMEIKTGTTDWQRLNTKGRKNMGQNGEGALG
jgi:hypothetical protein